MGSSYRAVTLTARAVILAAIRAAAVPAAPATVPMHDGRDDPHLLDTFLRALEEGGGRGTVCRDDSSLAETIESLLGAQRPGIVVVRGRFAVAENGAVYVDADDLDARVNLVCADDLVLVVPIEAIVPTMHEAVRAIPPGSRCGWFLSGPSKTADIEQSLVIGAQGARTVHVIFER